VNRPLLVIVLAGMLLATGCTNIRLPDSCGLNQGLDYMPWDLRGTCRCGKAADDVPHPPATITILPGMRLDFRYANLQPRTHNAIVPGLSSMQWVVPGKTFTPNDYFVLAYLLAASEHAPLDEVTTLSSYALPLSADAFQATMDATVYGPITDSLRYVLVNAGSPGGGLCSTAKALHQRLSEPLKDDFTRLGTPSALLTYQFPKLSAGAPDAMTMSLCWSGGAFFNQDVETLPQLNTTWYDSVDTSLDRSYVTIRIPVRLASELRSTYLPIDQSVGSLQRELGVPIAGIRRSKRFLRPLKTSRSAGKVDLGSHIAGSDGYFTVWFGHWRGWSGTHATTVVLANEEKDDLLFAPGDVVLLEAPHKRFAATDVPGGGR